MMKMDEKIISIKDSPLGQDLKDALWGKHPHGILDVSRAIVTLKAYLVHNLSPGDLKYLYPVYFDAARVMVAECVTEFFQTGRICITALDTEFWVYTDHEIHQIILTEHDMDTILRVLRKAQNPNHNLCSRWQDPADRTRWRRHVQELYDVLRQLK